MARRRKTLTEEDKSLWKKVTSTIVPMPGSHIKVPTASTTPAKKTALRAKPSVQNKIIPAPAPKPAQLVIPNQGLFSRPQQPSIDPKTRKKIAKGRVPIEARIDLHGMTQNVAILALEDFLFQARSSGFRLVLVITGKGEAGTGILRRQVPYWLTGGELATMVAGFQEAHDNHGGSGALYVRLKRLG